MVVRGVYTEAEKKMLAKLEKDADAQVGWAKLMFSTATADSLKKFAAYADPWNPIWRVDSYAASTRWGSIIAFPGYEYSFGMTMWSPQAPEDGSFIYESYVGEDWEFFKPIRPGDSIKVWNRRPRIEDITPLDGKGLRRFASFSRDADFINQKDELVSTIKLYCEQIIYPEVPEPYSMPVYGYTKEEAEYIDRVARAEVIRGANIRYWEDVSVGEELQPIVTGPTSVGSSAGHEASMFFGDNGMIRPREVLRKEPGPGPQTFLPGPDGLLYTHAGRHSSDLAAQAEGEPRGWLYGATSKIAMARCVTNWMGDDGFVRKMSWRHIARIAIGDTMIDTGRVINKRLENGEHLVDLLVWGRNMRGNIVEAGNFTVSLLSREAPFRWK